MIADLSAFINTVECGTGHSVESNVFTLKMIQLWASVKKWCVNFLLRGGTIKKISDCDNIYAFNVNRVGTEKNTTYEIELN